MNSWWQGRSLRFRLALWYSVSGIVFLSLFSAAVYFFVWYRVARPLDEALREDFAEVSSRLVYDADGKPDWGIAPFADSVKNSDVIVELWDDQNRLVNRYWPIGENLVEVYPSQPSQRVVRISIFQVSTDLTLRIYAAPIEGPTSGSQWMLRVMRQYVPARDAADELIYLFAVALPIVIACLVLGGYYVTRHWLAPLEGMVGEVMKISAKNLSRRIPVINPHDEIGRMGTVFNRTLDRLQQSFLTLDRFAADASHELRTPLTTLRSVGEVGLRKERTSEEYQDIIASMLEESQRLQQLVQRLLELARVERGPENIHHSTVRIEELVSDCVAEASILAENRGQTILQTVRKCTVGTDPLLLGQALRNLLDNAIKYSPPNTTIEVTAGPYDGLCRISVRDQGPGVPEEHRNLLAERFYRTDRSRERAKGGFGLGLAITKAYMHALGGTVEFEPAGDRGSIFHLTFPLKPEEEVAAAKPAPFPA